MREHNSLSRAGIPLVYELDAELRPIKHYFLADDETVRKALERVHPPPPRSSAKIPQESRRDALHNTDVSPVALHQEDRI